MVNIGTVIGITTETIQTFKTVESFWANGFNNPTTQIKKEREKFIARLKQCEDSLAAKYQLTQQQTRNLGLVFGSEKRMKEEMEDYENRMLLCNQGHIVITQVIITSLKITLVSTIHTNYLFKTVTSTFDFDQRIRLLRGTNED